MAVWDDDHHGIRAADERQAGISGLPHPAGTLHTAHRTHGMSECDMQWARGPGVQGEGMGVSVGPGLLWGALVQVCNNSVDLPLLTMFGPVWCQNWVVAAAGYCATSFSGTVATPVNDNVERCEVAVCV